MHRTITTREAKALAALYTEDAIFEGPAVIVTQGGDGILRGRKAIEDYFTQFFAKVGANMKEWYRDGTYFTNGRMLVW